MTESDDRPTGIVYSYRLIGAGPFSETFHGKYETRHEAIGTATKMANVMDADDWEIRWHESIWREAEEPAVCDHCGHVEKYLPLVAWTFDVDAGAFCSKECHARWLWQNDRERLYEIRARDREREADTDPS